MAVIHALYEEEHLGTNAFFLPPQDVLEPKGDDYEIATDLDLLLVRDGRLFIGEVKSSPEGFRDFDFDRLRLFVEDIRPDVVELTATGEKWPDDVSAKIKEFGQELAKLGVELRTPLMKW